MVTCCQGALWTRTVFYLRWSMPLTHGDVCHSPVHGSGGSELSLRLHWQSRDAISTRANCLTQSEPSFFLTSVPWLLAYNIWTSPFFFSLSCPNSNQGLSTFLSVRMFGIFLKPSQFFRVVIGKSIRHCFKIIVRNNNISAQRGNCKFNM